MIEKNGNSGAPAARGVASDRGLGWLTDSWTEFMKAPGLWVLLMVIALGLSVVCAMLPFGSILAPFLNTLVYAGMMLVAARQRRGETPEVGDLFAVLSHPALKQLLILAAIFFAMCAAALLIVFVLGIGGGLVGMLGAGSASDGGALAAGIGGLMLGLLVFLALLVPILALYWFALPLVLFRGMEPWPAMQASLAGVLANVAPMIVYGVVTFVLAVIASIPAFLGLLVAGPLIMISWYISYEEIYP